MTSASAGYSPDWVGEAGLNLDPGYCITMVRGVEPREALHRLGISDTAIRISPWSELRTLASGLKPDYEHVPTAAFVIGEYTVLVEENGYRGRLSEWNQPLSQGTEAVSVYLSPSNGNQELSVIRDGTRLAFIDGDQPEVIEGGDEELAGRLIQLTYAALKPWHQDDLPPADLGDGWVDLLQVACGYLGLQPAMSDISGPVPGAPVKL